MVRVSDTLHTTLMTYADMYEPVGSRVTCNPAPTDTDADYLVLVSARSIAGMSIAEICALPHDPMFQLERWLYDDGWTIGGSKPTEEGLIVDPDHEFFSYTKGSINLIITRSPIFWDRFIAATRVATRLNLMLKADRISLFQAVLYGRYLP